jgi:L-asparaginase/Glu-tRNA(Gln) amidotransferase subunit D
MEPARRRRHVAVLHTGGTLGMVRDAGGAYAPRAGALSEALRRLPELDDARLPSVRLAEEDELLDSSDVRPRDWQRIADWVGAAFAGGGDAPPPTGSWCCTARTPWPTAPPRSPSC